MALVPFANLLSSCLPELPGAPDSLIVSALRDTARALCQDARVWNTVQDVTLILNQPLYALVKPSPDTSVWFIASAHYNKLPLDAADEDFAARHNGEAGPPVCYLADEQGDINFIMQPTANDAGKAVTVRTVWIPTLTASTFPDDLLDRYRDCLVSGAKAALMRQPGQTWSNPQMFAYYEAQHVMARNKARMDQLHGRIARQFVLARRPFGR